MKNLEILLFLLIFVVALVLVQQIIGLLNLPDPAGRIIMMVVGLIALFILLNRLGMYPIR